MSLRWRIVAALALIVGSTATVAAVGAYLATERQLRSGIDETLVARADNLNTGPPGGVGPGGAGLPGRGGRGRPGPPGVVLANGCPAAGGFQPASAAQLVRPDGDVVPCIAGGPILPVASAEQLKSGDHRLQTVTVEGERLRILSTPWRDGGFLQIGRDLGEAQGVLDGLRLRLAGLALAGVAAAAVLGWMVASRITRPVMRLRDTAEAIATTQDLTTPIPDVGAGEVGSLAASLTTMVAALATSRDQQQRLITDASHEMRTPLTSLRTNLELLGHFEQLPEDDRGAALAALQVDVAELTDLLGELVELATDRSADETLEEVRLADLAGDVAGRARRRSGREITVEDSRPRLPEGSDATDSIRVRPQMLERAISNLVENAVKYSPQNSPVTITVDGGRLMVRDHGDGIDPADQPHVFERFYRSALARTEPGSGLGLAIVHQIVERHGGRVSVANHPDGGAVVGFELPGEPAPGSP